MNALAHIVDGLVANVIVIPEEAGAEFAGTLGLTGDWVICNAELVGPGFTYDAETGAFQAPPMPEETPPEEAPPEE